MRLIGNLTQRNRHRTEDTVNIKVSSRSLNPSILRMWFLTCTSEIMHKLITNIPDDVNSETK